MSHKEENTIEAINKLRNNYPYAASILVYIVIERELKEYINKNRKIDHCLIKEFKKYNDKSDNEFIKNCLNKKTLEDIEKLLKIKHHSCLSKDRNDLMHSNLYMLQEKNLKDIDRHNKNIDYFKKAKDHLIKIFASYSAFRILEEKDKLILKSPNKLTQGDLT